MMRLLSLALLLIAAPLFGSSQAVGNSGTVMDMLMAYPELSTLWDLVSTLGLSDDLAGAGPFTVFAPTNEAFSAISTATAAMDPTQLTRVVMYHVIVGEAIPRNGFITGSDKALSGDDIDIAVGMNGRVFINAGAAQITGASITASNGIIHKLTEVLLPPTALPVVAMNGNALYDEGGAFDPNSITIMDPNTPFDPNVATVPPATTTGTTGAGGGGGGDDKKDDDKKDDDKKDDDKKGKD